MNPAWVSALVALATALATLLVLVARIGWRLYRKTDAFLEDWNGRPESPGHPRQPGVMERLIRLEMDNVAKLARLDKQDDTLEIIKSEVTYNSGHSLKDTVRQIITRLNKFDPPDQLTGRK